MSILHEYRRKRAALRKTHNEMCEVLSAPDIPLDVKRKLIQETHENVVGPGLLEMHVVHNVVFTYATGKDLVEYLERLSPIIGYDPVDTSAGHH